jgi:hypothetical protein
MQIRMLTSRAEMSFVREEGEVIDVPEDEARRMIEAGQAEPVEAAASSPKPQRSRKRHHDAE